MDVSEQNTAHQNEQSQSCAKLVIASVFWLPLLCYLENRKTGTADWYI